MFGRCGSAPCPAVGAAREPPGADAGGQEREAPQQPGAPVHRQVLARFARIGIGRGAEHQRAVGRGLVGLQQIGARRAIEREGHDPQRHRGAAQAPHCGAAQRPGEPAKKGQEQHEHLRHAPSVVAQQDEEARDARQRRHGGPGAPERALGPWRAAPGEVQGGAHGGSHVLEEAGFSRRADSRAAAFRSPAKGHRSGAPLSFARPKP